MIDPPDDLAELLEPRPAGATAALRDTVLHQTERRLARGRWMRRSARAALVTLIFLSGSLAGWLMREPAAPGPVAPPEFVVVPVAVPVILPAIAGAPGSPGPTLSAAALELQAEQQDDLRIAAKLYRQAGDVFLREHDYSNATRCYRLYLARGDETALALDSTDSWLLVSLKNAAFREKIDVTKNDG